MACDEMAQLLRPGARRRARCRACGAARAPSRQLPGLRRRAATAPGAALGRARRHLSSPGAGRPRGHPRALGLRGQAKAAGAGTPCPRRAAMAAAVALSVGLSGGMGYWLGRSGGDDALAGHRRRPCPGAPARPRDRRRLGGRAHRQALVRRQGRLLAAGEGPGRGGLRADRRAARLCRGPCAAVVVYRRRQHQIDLFVWPEAAAARRATALSTAITPAHWTQDGFALLGRVRPQRFGAGRIRPPLARGLIAVKPRHGHRARAALLVDGDEGEHAPRSPGCSSSPSRARRQAATLSFIDVRPTFSTSRHRR